MLRNILYVTDMIRYMQDVGVLTLEELKALSTSVSRELRARRPMSRTCLWCGAAFSGRRDAQFCGTRCRVAAHRKRTTRRKPNVDITGIGYEGLTQDALISRLRLRGVETLVDVRLNAISRKPGFSKKALTTALEQAGIHYRHMPSLGNPRANRDGYAETTSPSARQARDQYRTTLAHDAAAASLSALVELARTQTIAVFCFEEDERHCHREQVLDHVRAALEPEMVRG